MCSTIILGRGSARVLAYNYDYSLGHGLIGTNPRGTRKASVPPPGQPVTRWDVRYGSVTLNSFALELPTCGMNERGLSVGLMRHEEGRFGDDTTVLRVNPLQWIQYTLDTHASVADVVEDLQRVQPRDDGFPLHYTVLDASGDCALIEFLDGRPCVTRDPAVPALTNSSYETSLRSVEAGETPPESASSLGRFATLCRLYSPASDHAAEPAAAFAILSTVRQGGEAWSAGDGATRTVWSVVFEPRARTIRLVTEDNPEQRVIPLDAIAFDETASYQLLDIHAGSAGTITGDLEPYRAEANRRIVRESARALPMPEQVQDEIVSVVDRLYRTRTM